MKFRLLILALLFTSIAISQDTLKVVASASIFADMAKNIGKDKVTATSIVPIGGDPHTYTPKPSDVKLVSEADIILINGLTFEGWIQELIDNSGTNAEIVLITEGITPITSQKYQNAADPHAWMDASNGLIYVQNITEALKAFDPLNIDYYQANYQTYSSQLKDLDGYIKRQIATIPDSQRVLITSHDAFQYYGRAYNVKLNAIMGISTESQAQTKDVVRIGKVIRENNVKAVFIESTINPRMLQTIAKDYNVKIGGELFSDSIGDEDSEAPTYLKMLKHNTDVITNALTGTSYSKTKIDSDTSNIWGYVMISVGLLLALLLFAWKMNK